MISWNLIDKYRQAQNRLVILDYDGTLVKFESSPDMAIPPDGINRLLIKLLKKPNTKVVILTGRSYQSIENFLGHLPLDIVADHGAMIKENNQWRPRVPVNGDWKPHALDIMNTWTQHHPNSFVEDKLFSLAWHFRNVRGIMSDSHLEELKAEIAPHVFKNSLKMIEGNKVLEVMPRIIGKGIAAEYLLHRGPYDYILSVGDDSSDEEVFELLSESRSSHTVKVGKGESAAKYNIDAIDGVHWLLETISA